MSKKRRPPDRNRTSFVNCAERHKLSFTMSTSSKMNSGSGGRGFYQESRVNCPRRPKLRFMGKRISNSDVTRYII